MNPDDEATLTALEAKVGSIGSIDDAEADWVVGKVQRAVLKRTGALRALRTDELDPALGRLLRVLACADEPAIGLLRELSVPSTRRSLKALVGLGPKEGFDRDLTVEGHGTTSILGFARDAVAGRVPVGAVLEAIEGLGPDALEETLVELVSTPGHVLTKVAQKDDPLVFLRPLVARLGERAEPALLGALQRSGGNKLLAIRAWLETPSGPEAVPEAVRAVLAVWAEGPPPMRAAAAPLLAAVKARASR